MLPLSHVTEPDMSQYNGDQWDRGLCGGTGDEPSAVQSSLCHLCLDVRIHTHWFCWCLYWRISIWEMLQLVLFSLNDRNAVVVIMAGFLIDKLGNRCKFISVIFFKRVTDRIRCAKPSSVCSLQSGCFCSLSCVFWARPCLHWVPTSKELPICCRWCSQAACSLDQEMDLSPVSLHCAGSVASSSLAHLPF